MEIGSPGKTLFFFNLDIVIPVPIMIATAVRAAIIILFVNRSTLEVSRA